MDIQAREKLTVLIEEEGGVNWWDPQGFIDHVRSRLPAELVVLLAPPSSSANFNCFVYALGLEGDPAFLGGQNPIQQEFIKHLVAIGTLKITETPVVGDLIFYKNSEGEITHGGILVDETTVRSKWMWGALFSHSVWDVPSSFGDEIFYCECVDLKDIRYLYAVYKDSGVHIKPIS